jgi:hypothetical protein
LETAPSLSRLFQSNVDDCDDPVVAVNDDDLITNDEVHVPAPLGMDLDERRGNLHHPHAGWHRGADADSEVGVINPRHIPAGQDCLSDLRALLRCQVDAAARLSLLRLALLSLALLSLPLLRSLAWLSLALLRCLLSGLALLRRLTGLALLTLLALRRLAGGLIALLLSLATLLGLTLLAAILLRPLIAITLALRSLFSLTLGRLACGLSFLPALRLALLLSLRALLRLALFVVPALGLATWRRLRLLALGCTAALLSSALHILG